VYRWVNSGGSFGSNPLRQEIGVADATAVAAVIRWPSGAEQPVAGLAPGGAYTIREGDPQPQPITLKRVQFARQPAAPAAHDHHGHGAPSTPGPRTVN
jgi:hypothetical protein